MFHFDQFQRGSPSRVPKKVLPSLKFHLLVAKSFDLLYLTMTYPTSELPLHLQQYVATQDYDLYTPIDHASWRYIMRVSTEFFKHHAHPKYLDGLIKTGVTIEMIPRISEMDEKLQKFGWRAVIVTGFIPPEPFLEMLAHRVLPIAADMRKLEHIDYTPAPDIVHEAAGHAPILADPDYSSYLKKFGEIARKVIFAKEDHQLYEAILHLSETKEDPLATPQKIREAEMNLEKAVENVGYVSEAQKITRLGWWSIEYGLFEKDSKYLIYGAGLLSSVGESFNCFTDQVRKVPLTVDCVDTSYDITKPQPQLFVTDDFKKLEKVIEDLSLRMAYCHGGIEALQKAKKAGTVTTTVLNTGLQISGVLDDYQETSSDLPTFLKWGGPVQLSFDDRQIEGHDASYHGQGFSSPLGTIKGLKASPEKATLGDWKSIGCVQGEVCRITFESGFTVEGIWTQSLHQNGKTLVMSFEQCTVKSGEKIYFMPQWGAFDMALGSKVVSVFGGAADRDAYAKVVQKKLFKPRPQKSNYLLEQKELYEMYREVRHWREHAEDPVILKTAAIRLESYLKTIETSYPDEWLLRLELLEVSLQFNLTMEFRRNLVDQLLNLSKKSDRLKMLIGRGLELLPL